MAGVDWRELNRKQAEEGLPDDLVDEDGAPVRFHRREPDTGRCESCNGLHSDCGEA